MRKLLLLAVLTSTLSFGRTLTFNPTPSPIALPSSIQIFCEITYKPDSCQAHAEVLAEHLHRLPLDRIAGWKFVLVPSNAWQPLMRQIQGNPDSPAFSLLASKTIVVEEALFAATVQRQIALRHAFFSHGGDLLDLALTHELGHAVCMDKDEYRADDFGRRLRSGKETTCHTR